MNRIVVITGATSGIGLATANAFTKAGDKVIAISRTENKDAKFAKFYSADVTDAKRLEEVFADIKAEFGHIDIVVNNAGYGMSGATELIPLEDARAIFDVNVIGKFLVSKYALPLMQKGGKIFYISSSMAVHPVPFRALYGASKAAVRSIALAQRMECRDFGIDVCCIMPGDVKTNFTAARVKDFKTNERYGDRIKQAVDNLDSKEEHRMPPEKVAQAIFKQANKRKTNPQVIVGAKHKFFYFIVRMSLRLYLKAAEKVAGGGSAKKSK